MKRLIAIVLVVFLFVSITACGAKETPSSEAPISTEASEIVTTPATPAEGTALSTEFWSLTYPDDWQVDPEEINESEGSYASATLNIPESDSDDSLVSVYIEASIESPEDFRDYFKSGEMDAFDLIENGNAVYTPVGGVDCLSYTGSYWGDSMLQYFGRAEGAGATVSVRIIGEYEDERVAALLSTLQFTLSDEGKVDPPWPWNGTPFTVEPMSTMVANVTLSSQQLPLADSLIVDDIFSGQIAVSGDKVYVLLDNVLTIYSFDGSALTYSDAIQLEDDYETITACENGIVYLAGFGTDLIGVQDGAVVCSYEGPDYVTMHPSGNWGISFFTGNEVEKISINDSILSTEAMTFPEVSNISSVSISQDHIIVAGNSVANENHGIFVYDLNANLQMTLGDKEFGEPDSLGSVTVVIETANGFFALDGNMRDIPLWNSDGQFIGTVEDSDLFGTSYPWLSGAAMLSDGSLLVGMTEERADSSADEFILFHLTGF